MSDGTADLLRYAEGTSSSRPGMRRIVGSAPLSLFSQSRRKVFDNPPHDECTKSERMHGKKPKNTSLQIASATGETYLCFESSSISRRIARASAALPARA